MKIEKTRPRKISAEFTLINSLEKAYQLPVFMRAYLRNDSTYVSEQSDSRPNVIPYLLCTEVNLHFDNSATVVIALMYSNYTGVTLGHEDAVPGGFLHWGQI